MKPLVLSDIEPIAQYQDRRDEVRRRIISLKKIRRVRLGERVAIVFENRDTMWFQVQEMCRIEHIEEPAFVQQEIDVYNDLLPEGLAIGATLLIELVQTDDMPKILRELSGLEETIWLRFGDEAVHAEAEPGRSTEEKTSSVHYLTFRFSPLQQQALAEASAVRLSSELAGYRHETVLGRETVASLVGDLVSQY